MQNAKSVSAVGHKCESAGVNHANLYVVHVVELAVRIEDLIEAWGLGIFDVNNGDSVFTRGNLGVRSRDVDIAGVIQSNFGVHDELRMRELGYVEHFHSVSIDDKCIAELHGDPARIVESGCADVGSDARGERCRGRPRREHCP